MIPATDAIEQMLASIPSLPRPMLSRLVTHMIDHLDDLDGDADIEMNGDELDGTLGEDDFHDQSQNWLGYPGCPVADPGGCEHDGFEPDNTPSRITGWEGLDTPRTRIRSNRCSSTYKRRYDRQSGVWYRARRRSQVRPKRLSATSTATLRRQSLRRKRRG